MLRTASVGELDLPAPRSVAPSTPLAEVYRLLDEQRPGAVVICDAGRPVGIFTERDVLYRTALEHPDPSTPIELLMRRGPVTLPTDAPLAAAVRAMLAGGFRHLPLVDGEGRLAGLLTGRAVLRFLADSIPEALLNLPPRLHQKLLEPHGG